MDGVCPCDDSTCAFCKTGFSGLKICQLCKKGYTLENNECICNIPNCRQCGENKCLICESGFYYNNTPSRNLYSHWVFQGFLKLYL